MYYYISHNMQENHFNSHKIIYKIISILNFSTPILILKVFLPPLKTKEDFLFTVSIDIYFRSAIVYK